MKADLEWISGVMTVQKGFEQYGVIRAGASFEKYGDAFEFVCTIKRRNDKAFICGGLGVFSRETYRAVEAVVFAAGVKEVKWERSGSKTREIVKDISKGVKDEISGY